MKRVSCTGYQKKLEDGNYEYWVYFMNNDKENIAYQGYLTLIIFRTEKICNQFYNGFRTVRRMNQSSSLTSLQIDSINISVYVPKVTTLEIERVGAVD